MERVVAVERAADTLAVDGERATARERRGPVGVDGDRNRAIAMPSTIHVAAADNKRHGAYASVGARSDIYEIV